MQDKSKNILTDKGWDAMELILDKEMPQKKKRRFLIWWLFGGLLLVSTYLVVQYNFTKNEKPQIIAYENENNSQNKVINLDSEINKTKDAELTTNKIGSPNKISDIAIVDKEAGDIDNRATEEQDKLVSTAKKTVEPKISNGNIPISNAYNKTQPNGELESQNQFLAKGEIVTDILVNSKINNETPITQSSKENTIETFAKGGETAKQEAKFIEGHLVQNENTKGNEVDPDDVGNLVDINLNRSIEEPLKDRLILKLAELSPISIFKELSFDRDITIVETKVKKPSYWYGAVAGYLNWGPKDNLYGLDTQVEIGYSFNGRHDLGLSVGVGSFRYDASTNQETAIATSGRMMFSNAEAANVLNSNFSNASHLDLGMHTGWNISPVIKLRADVGYSYFFSPMFDVNNNNAGAGLDVSSPAPTGGVSLDSEILVEGEKGSFLEFEYKLDREWVPYAGLSFQLNLNSNLAIDFGYRKVFGELFESSSNPLSMDRARLGIKYRFLKKASKP